MMRNCMQRNKIAELVLGAPRETAEMAKPQSWAGRPCHISSRSKQERESFVALGWRTRYRRYGFLKKV